MNTGFKRADCVLPLVFAWKNQTGEPSPIILEETPDSIFTILCLRWCHVSTKCWHSFTTLHSIIFQRYRSVIIYVVRHLIFIYTTVSSRTVHGIYSPCAVSIIHNLSSIGDKFHLQKV